MAAAIPVISVVASVVGAGTAVKGAMDAKKAGKENAARAKAEAEEQARRTRIEQQKIEALARARAAASGSQGGSVDAYLAGLQDEHQKELQWIAKAGGMQESAEKTAGKNAASAQWASAAGYAGQAGATAASQKSWWS